MSQDSHNRNLRARFTCRASQKLREAGWQFIRDDESMSQGWADPNGEGFMSLDRAYNVLLGISDTADDRHMLREKHKAFCDDFYTIVGEYIKHGC